MTVRYVSDHELDWDQLSLALGSCRDQLEAVIDDLPSKDDDGSVWEKGSVIQNVIHYLEAIKDEVDDHSPAGRCEVRIIPSLHRRVEEHCTEHLGEFSDLGIEDTDHLVKVIVNQALSELWGNGFDLRRLVEGFPRLIAAYIEATDEGPPARAPHYADSPAARLEENRKALRKEVEQLREQLAKLVEEKCAPTAGQSGRTAKARRPHSTRKASGKARRRQSRAA